MKQVILCNYLIQQELLRSINLELQESLNPLRDLRTRLNQQCERILQDIQSINQILNEEESIFSENQQENQHQEHQNHDLNSYVSMSMSQGYQSRIKSSLLESYKQVIQNSQQQREELCQILPEQLRCQYNQTLTIILVFDHLVNAYEIEIDSQASIGDLAQEFKIVLNHQKEILFSFEGNILEEEFTFQQLNIQNGYTLQAQLIY
ncbi:unnamed protein product (macronuclear) [Paramecium tetraurelia]|uniref:Ubiquitin-like domain-containing protein n=1 Tax=Paramecium tetraurelia TaxID=5888 RepID=A0CAK1_PARTE|nr:uncharacterized protein GSPATT00036598001 [Paramecium tetraurelia]CAK67818.1 unnamed protein product [Paramecium tetraurelia]|eukprot:XP_001435215.1 hypothetical protein (macronuclear) [Paramecium tetraurelia strain d4-2]